MGNRDDTSRSTAQAAMDTARAAKGLIRVVRAAMLSGLHGAAIAAAKEFLPSLVKWAAVILILLLMLPYMLGSGAWPHGMTLCWPTRSPG